MGKYSITGILLLFAIGTQAQCPTAAFTAPASVCQQENIYIQNTTTGASTFEWDFCSGDLQLNPTPSFVVASSAIFRARVFRIVQDQNGLWFGFAIDQPNNVMARFEFGNRPDNVPSVVVIGNPGASFQNPLDLDFFQENDQWYALVANTNGNNLLLLSFGNSLTHTPTVTNLGSFGVLNAPSGIDVIKNQNHLYAFVTTNTPETVVSLYFGNTVLSSPTVSVYPVAGASGLRSLSFIKECDKWFGLVTSYNNNQLFYLRFDSGLNAAPVINQLNIPGAAYSFPATVRLLNEGAHYYALIQSAFPAHLYKIDFGESITDLSGTFQNLGNLGISNDNAALDVASFDSRWRAFSIDLSGAVTPGAGRLFRLSFPDNCASALRRYLGPTPPAFQYTMAGIFRISLKVEDEDGNTDYHFNNVAVNNFVAPDITFTTTNECATAPVYFLAQNNSGNLTSYQWNFDDTGTSTLQNPAHTYATAGTYQVQLEVTASNGCANRVRNPVTIYNPPMADFQLPAVTPFCTNQPYVFNNTTAFDAGSHITWTWLLNNTPVSSSEHLTYTFTQTTAHDIGLIAAIPGCQSQVVKNIAAVAEGPVVDFSTAGHCQMEPVNFTNHTTGTVTSYLWQFDDGNTSTAENPVHSYTMPGVYQVQLSATNAAGCVNTAVRPVRVYARPQTDFSVALPPFSCSGGPTQFTDLTPNPTDSNLATWLWDFNDGGATSTVRHAQHTYATAGQYAVSLTVTTNFGCSATAQKDVQIYPSPNPTFTFSPPCRAVPVQFTDGTTGPLQQWFWQIETSTYTTQNPVHTFSTSGPKNVTLTVTAANGCVGSTTQTLQVPAILVPDFMAERTCTHQQTLFTSLTNDAADPIASFNWNFGSAGTASGNPAVATFTATGNPAITLTVTTQTGCAYARTKNINISAAPAAAFSVSADVGGAPLTVQFTNTSAGATAYLWEFGEGSASTEVSPQFTYQAIGTYVASLTAFNAIQCQSKAVRTIHVVNPVLDVQVPLLELMQSGTGFTPAVTIQNRSNVPLINPVVAYDLAGAATVQEIVPATIAPNASYRHVSALVYPGMASAYLCATLLVDDGTPADNRYCATAEQTTAVIAPFPNPVSRQQQQLTIGLSASRPGVAFIEMLTLTGQQVFAQSVQVAQGYNAVQINPWYLNEGMYLLRLQANEQWFAFRIQVIR